MSEENKIAEPKIKDYQMHLHISMSKKHSAIHKGVIVWEGNLINGKTIVVETHTPKTKNGNFRKSDTSIYLEEKDSPMFKSMKEFKAYYLTYINNNQ